MAVIHRTEKVYSGGRPSDSYGNSRIGAEIWLFVSACLVGIFHASHGSTSDVVALAMIVVSGIGILGLAVMQRKATVLELLEAENARTDEDLRRAEQYATMTARVAALLRSKNAAAAES